LTITCKQAKAANLAAQWRSKRHGQAPSDLFKYYKHGTPHQMAAVAELEAELINKAKPRRSLVAIKRWYQDLAVKVANRA
jgi:hypothetical protein